MGRMAKRQKYADDLLLEAVIKFSEIEKGKIKATELARWARENMLGLEEVKDYHFTRAVKEKNDKTGKMEEKPKLCTLKIEEINKARTVTKSINSNMLLRSSNIDTFMEQPDTAKRKMVVQAREIVDKLVLQNGNLKRENEALKSQNKKLVSEIDYVKEQISAVEIAQRKLIKQVNYIMRITDETARKQMLSEMGIKDGSIDLDQYNDSLEQNIHEVMNLNKVLRKYVKETYEAREIHNNVEQERNMEIPENIINNESDNKQLTADILSGIDF